MDPAAWAMAIILIVDDDPLQAYVRKAALEKFFADVRRVSAAEALCLVEQSQIADQLALVIAGTLMPGLSRTEFVTELSLRLPWLPVLVLDSDQAGSGGSGNQVQHIAQPLSGEQLARLSRQMVEQHKFSAA